MTALVVPSGGGSRTRPKVDVGQLWADQAATAIVAGLVALVGVLVCRWLFNVPILAPKGKGVYGDADTTDFVLATALAHLGPQRPHHGRAGPARQRARPRFRRRRHRADRRPAAAAASPAGAANGPARRRAGARADCRPAYRALQLLRPGDHGDHRAPSSVVLPHRVRKRGTIAWVAWLALHLVTCSATATRCPPW